MHSQAIINQFIELRADGQSFGDISQQLGIPKPTLHRWADEHAADILRLRRTEWEDAETTGRWRAEDLLLDLNSDLDRLDEHVRRFSVQHLSLRDTIMLMREKRRERDRLRALLMGPGSRRGRDGAPPPSGSALPVTNLAAGESGKTERSHENGTTQPRHTNDLQQSEPEPFHFPPGENSAAESNNSQVTQETPTAPPLPRGEGWGDGQTGLPPSPPPRVAGASASAEDRPDMGRGDGQTAPHASNKTERSHENGTTQPRHTNDLQQSESESFHFSDQSKTQNPESKIEASASPCLSGSQPVDVPSDSSLVVPASAGHATVQPDGWRELPGTSIESSTSHPPAFPPAHLQPAPSVPKLAELDPDDPNFYDGSIVIGNDEPARSILERHGVKLSKSRPHASPG